MSLGVAILLVLFAVLLLLNVPVAFTLAIMTVVAMFATGYEQVFITVSSDMASGVNIPSLLAIPFFILAGDLMGEGGLARRLIEFASALVGRFRGGLGMVNTLACMFFGAISGSAAAAISSIGGALIPEMNKQGYGKNFNIALTVTSATTGLLIPPSNVMIVYAVVAGNVSVAALFLAGVLPGILMGILIMAVCFLITRKQTVGSAESVSFGQLMRSFYGAFPSLLLIVIVMGGILSGVFSATEASAVAAAYAFLLGVVVYKELKLEDLFRVFLKAAKTTSVVMLLVGASQAMSWVLAYEQVPQSVSEAMLSLSSNPVVTLLLINVLLLAVGVFMDMTPAILIFTPIFLPVVTALGMDPVHFGILMITNLCIGLCTPPVGTCLFVGCSVGGTTIAKALRPMLPLFAAMVVGLVFITYAPALSLWLPSLFGL